MPDRPPPSEADLLAGHAKVADGASVRVDLLFCLVVLVVEGALLLLTFDGKLPLLGFLGLHAGVVGVFAMLLDWRERRGADSRLVTIALVSVAITGPLGALLTMILGLALMSISVDGAILRRWYDRIAGAGSDDDAELLLEQIVSGRTLNPHLDAGASFLPIMRSGPLEEKQRVLGLIAQKYHPDYAGLLEAAMRSPDPPLRVQAAAVAARLQGDERARLKVVAAAAESAMADPAAAIELCRRLERQLESGLLDHQDRALASTLAVKLARAAQARLPDEADAAIALGRVLAAAGLEEEAVEVLGSKPALGSDEAVRLRSQCLLKLRRFADLPIPAGAGQAT